MSLYRVGVWNEWVISGACYIIRKSLVNHWHQERHWKQSWPFKKKSNSIKCKPWENQWTCHKGKIKRLKWSEVINILQPPMLSYLWFLLETVILVAGNWKQETAYTVPYCKLFNKQLHNQKPCLRMDYYSGNSGGLHSCWI